MKIKLARGNKCPKYYRIDNPECIEFLLIIIKDNVESLTVSYSDLLFPVLTKHYGAKNIDSITACYIVDRKDLSYFLSIKSVGVKRMSKFYELKWGKLL